MSSYIKNKKRSYIIITAALVALAIIIVLSATLGAASISVADSLHVLLSKVPFVNRVIDLSDISQMHQTIILEIRLPRILLSIFVGGMLAISGAVYQSVFRNPMADPFVLGISSGAALGAALAMILGLNVGLFGISSVSIAAFIGALITTLVVYRIATYGQKTPILSLVLTGIALGFFLSALLSLMITFNRDQLEQIIFWMYGSFATANWFQIGLIAPIFLFTTAIFLIKARLLNVMTLGEAAAQSLGVNVQRERMLLLITASLATATAVSLSGIIGFVGLVIPHMMRLLSGPDNRTLLPYSVIGGAIFLLMCDALARTVVAPMEVPIGIISSLVGAPYFVFLIVRNKRAGRSL